MDCHNLKITISKKEKEVLSRELLETKPREELIERIIQLDAYNTQLKNILSKKNSGDENSQFKNKTETNSTRKINFEKEPKRHVLLKFYYLGWNYQGYVVQEDTNNTIEFFLFHALKKCCLIENREKSNYHRCGRTDKGVSAFSQVISLDLRSKFQEPSESNVNEEFPYCVMLNRLLPENIRCYAWCHVGSNVSSRFNCNYRTYKYYFPKGNLDLNLMEEGAKLLIGTHDFRNFCKMDVANGVTEFVREIQFVEIRQCSSSREKSGYKIFELVLQGSSFLWHQIRCIMSVLFLIGQKLESPNIVKELLNVEKNPYKPQYSLANYLPLNLYNVDYGDIPTQWNFDTQDLLKTIKLLQSQWTKYSVKSAMIRDIIENLQNINQESLNADNQVECLLDGVKSKVYKPLLLRMKCGSVESKIKHYVKRRKLQIPDFKEGTS